MLNSSQHFILSFLGPPIFAAVVCYLASLLQFWLKMQQGVLIAALLVVFILAYMFARWAVRAWFAVRCPFCGGRSYEIEGRGNRFMCLVCGKDH